MAHYDQVGGSYRIHMIRSLIVIMIVLLLMFVALVFSSERADAQTNNTSPTSEGSISTLVGNGDREFGTGEGLDPFGMATDSAGNIYIADLFNHRVRKIAPDGVMTTVAGSGQQGFDGDSGPAIDARLNYPHDVAIDAAGNLYIADLANNRIRKVAPDGIITTVVGTGDGGFGGDGGPATRANIWGPKGVAVDSTGNIYIADFDNGLARKVDTNGIITTVAGGGADKASSSGAGVPATSVNFTWLTDIEVDDAGNLYLADEAVSQIYKVDTSGMITILAGTDEKEFSGDGGPAASASLSGSKRIALDGLGNLYISDSSNSRVRKVDTNGIITTVAGNGSTGFSGDGGAAISAGVPYPNGITVDAAGNIYIGSDNRIRKVAGKTSPVALPTAEPTAAPILVPTATPEPTLIPTIDPTPEPTVDPNAPYFEPASLNFVWQKGSRSNPASQKVVVRKVGGAGWTMHQWVSVPAKQWVQDGFEMTVAVSPANANLDVGIHETRLDFVTGGVTITLPIQISVVSADGKLQVNRNQLNFGGFVGDAITDQVVGLTFTRLNSTNWTATGPSWLTLTPASGSVSATAPTEVKVGINTAAIRAAGRYTDTLVVSDGKTTHNIAVELFQVEPGSPTIQLFGLEVTQGLQNLNSDIPFVAKRPVFVRGHVRSLTGEPIQKVTAQLIGTRAGVELGTLSPINPGGSVNIIANPDRSNLHDSFLFELPENWRTGTVTLRLLGQSQPIACVDPAEKSAADAVANDCTVTLTYETIPDLPITYFLYQDVGNVTSPRGNSTASFVATVAHAQDATRGLIAGLPIPGVNQQIHGTVLTYPGQRMSSADNGKVLDNINKLYEKDGKPIRHYYGLFARYPTTTDPSVQTQGGPGGVAHKPGFAGMGEYYTFQPYSLLNAHELAHNFGRSHVACGNPAGPDPNYPHPNQQISDAVAGDAAYFGFNIYSQEIYPPTYKDMMTYCWPQWISPYTYKAVIERMKIHYATGEMTQTVSAANSPVLLIHGSIHGPESGSIDGVVGDNGIPALSTENASGYSVRLEDADGQTVATYPVAPQLIEGQADEGDDHEDAIVYALAVPQPENLARVILVYEEQPLAERVGSTNAPTITLMTPVEGESVDRQSLVIEWEASDADGDALLFNVDYSIDGGENWQKLAWDWQETTLEVDSSFLPGSAQARIRVGVNDGFHTSFVESDLFTVADQAPVAIILNTRLNAYYVGGQTILLEGIGYDREDGEVSDLTWYSDRDGVLGTGSTLLLNADSLSEGSHLIRLEAVDSAGQSSFGDSTVGVVSEDAIIDANDTVRFDVLYDPLTLPAELAVGPTLNFQTASGDEQLLTETLTISNLGDGDLRWTANSDSAFVTLSSSSGNTPATVAVTVDPSGLAEGLHEGTLTFTPDDATLAPVTINYAIRVFDQLPVDDTLPRVQAESGTYTGAAAAGDFFDGFDGTGFAAYLASVGDAILLTTTVDTAGPYMLSVRYAAGIDGPATDRTLSLYVNDSKVGQLVFVRTFDWSVWSDISTRIDLNAGDNTIEFRVDEDDTGTINLDYIDLVPLPNVAAASSGAAPSVAMCDATDVPEPSAGAVMVRFVNESGGSVAISWRDFGGNLLEYHQLDANGYVDQESFETHEWVVADKAGNVLLDYMIGAELTQCVLIQ